MVEESLQASHLFALLTLGENFGHAIGEALRAGCPVLISDQTPWTDVVATGAGVVLDEPARRHRNLWAQRCRPSPTWTTPSGRLVLPGGVPDARRGATSSLADVLRDEASRG